MAKYALKYAEIFQNPWPFFGKSTSFSQNHDLFLGKVQVFPKKPWPFSQKTLEIFKNSDLF